MTSGSASGSTWSTLYGSGTLTGGSRAWAAPGRDGGLHPRQTSTVPERHDSPVGPPARPPREAVQRWRLVVRRDPVTGAETGRAHQEAWEAALRRSGLPVAGLDAPAARPRLAIAAPLPAAVCGEAELYDIWLTDRLPRWRVREALADIVPAAHGLTDLYDVWLGEPPLPGRVVASVYLATIDPCPVSADRLAEAAAGIEAARSVPRRRVRGERTIDYDLRPMVDHLEVREAGTAVEVAMALRHDPEKGVGRPEEVLGELGDRIGATLAAARLVRERLVLAGERNP